MEVFNQIFGWLNDNETALSALAALVVIIGVVVSPLGAGVRGILSSRNHAKQSEASAAADTLSNKSNIQPTRDFLDTPPPLITDKPSIAVLPFVNMSDDKTQEYFADGMTEDIITGLSCDSRLFVIARNSTFAYKGQSPDIRQVGKELGVRYVLEGSVRPMAERLRITVQLIETETGTHVWADKIDRPVADIFNIMDDIVDGIVISLCANIKLAESDRASRKRPEDVDAWALCVQAEVLFISQPDSGAFSRGIELARRASEIEPGYGVSWALLALFSSVRVANGLSGNLSEDSEHALSLVDKAINLAPHDPVVLSYCGFATACSGEAARAISFLERSLDMNPNNSFARLYYGVALYFDSRLDDCAAQLRLFIAHSPRDLYIGVAVFHLSLCYASLGDFEQAEQQAQIAIKHTPGFGWNYIALGLALTALGRETEAQIQWRTLEKIEPALTRQNVKAILRLWIKDRDYAERLISLLERH